MINVSKEFWDVMKERTDFLQYGRITFLDGTVLELTPADFTISNNKVVDGPGVSKIPLGAVVCRSIQIELMNDDEKYSSYDFFGAVIKIQLKLQLSENVETIDFGEFTVVTPETYGETVILTAVDDIWKADRNFYSTLSFPTTTGELLRDICSICGISLGTTTFRNSDFEIASIPDGNNTFRSVIGYIAQIAGGNARINRTGKLEIISYNFVILREKYDVYDGGYYNPWKNKSVLDGGTFSPWTTEGTIDGGSFGDRNDIHLLYQWSYIKVDTDDVVITGVQTEYTNDSDEKVTLLEGEEGYVLGIDNPLIAGKELEALKLIGSVMIGARFRQFEGDHISYPLAEFMDPCWIVDRKNHVYTSIITDINFTFFGLTTLKNSSETAVRNSSHYASESTKNYIKSQKLVVKERTEREKAIENLSKTLSESGGLYMTTEIMDDGSTVYYAHDKPSLSESKIVWKFTVQALGISLDGGNTYLYGLDASGDAILNEIYAIGINANYIKSGSLIVGDKNNPNGKVETISSGNTGNVLGTALYKGRILSYNNGSLLGGIIPTTTGPVFATADTALALGVVTDDEASATVYYYLNNGLNPNNLTEKHLFNGAVRFLSQPRVSGIYFMPSNVSGDESEWVHLYNTNYDNERALRASGGFYADGSIGCAGTKYRVVDTDHFGKRGMNAFETTEPYFSDIGSSIIGENGMCKISFDPIFFETIDPEKQYQVQITATSSKEVCFVEKQNGYFIVHGDQGATFDWMLMCKQKGYADVRMQEIIIEEDKKE